MKTERKPRKDKKYRFTKEELKSKVYDALIWASDGTEILVGDREPTPWIMGDPENLSFIISEIVTSGLPEDDSSSSPS